VAKLSYLLVREALDSQTGNRERIRASFQAYFDFVDEQADGFRLLMQETVGAEREFRDRVARTRDRIRADVADLIVGSRRASSIRTMPRPWRWP
jgi:hypothetical protein